MSLLLKESPIIAAGAIGAVYITSKLGSNWLLGASIVVLIFLFYFYRYCPPKIEVPDNILLSPCEGKVTMLRDDHDYYYISVFLSPMNKHWQIYPVNGVVIDRIYDHSGKYRMVMHADKSQDNEKKMHYIMMNNGTVLKLTQIAGFLPRMITSSDEIGVEVKAGQYLGMIKFGSRVEILVPKKARNGQHLILNDDMAIGKKVKIGEQIGEWM